MNELALFFKYKAMFAEAEPLVRRALAIDEASYGPDHPAVARVLLNLAVLEIVKGNRAHAVPLLERALGIFRASLGEDHPHVQTTLRWRARARK